MKDFKVFLEKVLSPIRGPKNAEPLQKDIVLEDKANALEQEVPPEELECQYVEVMNVLLADASDHQGLRVFVDVVAWKLAVLAHHCRPKATSDVLQKFGGHLSTLTEASDAQREADEAKKSGLRPN